MLFGSCTNVQILIMKFHRKKDPLFQALPSGLVSLSCHRLSPEIQIYLSPTLGHFDCSCLQHKVTAHEEGSLSQPLSHLLPHPMFTPHSTLTLITVHSSNSKFYSGMANLAHNSSKSQLRCPFSSSNIPLFSSKLCQGELVSFLFLPTLFSYLCCSS